MKTEDAVLVSSMIFGKSNIGFGGKKNKTYSMRTLKFRKKMRKSRRNKRKMRGGGALCPKCQKYTYECGYHENGRYCICSSCGFYDTPWGVVDAQ